MRKDIYGGLKNALERGENLEQAVRSFINAGYPESEVRQTAQTLSSGTQISQQPFAKKKQLPPLPKNQLQGQTVQTPKAPPQTSQIQRTVKKQIRRKTDWRLIILGIVLFFLVLILVGSIFLKNQIIDFFSGLF